MTQTAETPAERSGTLRSRLMNEFRRVPDGLDPDDVYAYIIRLQARIDFLEEHVREVSNPAILDATLRQAADIRRQALEGAERAWTEIVHAADEEVVRRRDEASHSARHLLEDACAEIQVVHDRLRASMSTENPNPNPHPHRQDSRPRHTATNHREQPNPVGGNDIVTRGQDGTINATCPNGTDAEPPFCLPAWIQK